MSARSLRIFVAMLVALGMLSGATAALADTDYPPSVPEPPVEPEVPEPPVEPEVPEPPVEPEEPEVGEEIEEEQPAEVVEEETAVLGVALPRTGTSVTLLALVGAVLIGLGALLVTRRRSSGEPA